MSVRKCDRCKAVKRDGERCKIRTCTTGPYCWLHTKSLSHLRVKPSYIPAAGKGLYTLKARNGGELVGDYTGDILNTYELNRRYPGDTLGEYVITGPRKRYRHKWVKTYIDARDTNAGNMRYINTCDAPVGQKRVCRNNVESVTTKKAVEIRVCPGVFIGPNSELYMSYGDQYDIGGRKLDAKNCQ